MKTTQIKENYIQLYHTKSGNPRKVYLDSEAIAFINSLPKLPNTDRFFTYTNSGMDRVYREFTKRNGLSHIHFHDLRRMAISRIITKIGSDNSLFISEFLGIQSVRKLESIHIAPSVDVFTQKNALFSFGHENVATTKVYFNMPKIGQKVNTGK